MPGCVCLLDAALNGSAVGYVRTSIHMLVNLEGEVVGPKHKDSKYSDLKEM